MPSKNPTEYNRQYYRKHKERLNAANRKWYRANKPRAVQLATQLSNRVRTRPKDRAMHMLRAARARAKKKGLEFNLELSDILPSLEWGACSATGIEFEMSTAKGRHPFTPSIDRRDVAKGYVRGNVRVVVWALNAMRGDWGDDVMMQVVNALAERF